MNATMPVDENGKAIPVLGFGNSINIDGTLAHEESDALDAGIYRLAVKSSTADGITVALGPEPEEGEDGTYADENSTYMPVGLVETIKISNGTVISVLGGILNVTRLS